jgi:hypothetical protein
MAKINVDEYGSIQFEEVFNSITFKTSNGQVLAVCMRDDGFEIGLSDPTAKGGSSIAPLLWFTANEGQITSLTAGVK